MNRATGRSWTVPKTRQLPILETREFVRPLSGGAPKEQKRSVAHLRLLALILGFLGWATLAYALVVLLIHDRAMVVVDNLGPWEPWSDVVAVAVALSATGAALVGECRTSWKSKVDVRRLRYDPDRNPHADRDADPDRIVNRGFADVARVDAASPRDR